MSSNNQNINTTQENSTLNSNNFQSSLKFFSFEEMTKDQIIEKFDETLFQREKQIRDIAYEIGIINEKLVNVNRLKNNF
jgi:hypothetical protein